MTPIYNSSCGRDNAVIATNPNNDDIQHPVSFRNITLVNVSNSSLVFIHRTNPLKVNPSDCGDMDCDGRKKALLTDEDGSFLGYPGTVFSEAEYDWGSQQKGVGDFRIPRELLTAPDGSWIDPKNIYSEPGIVRDNETCVYEIEWQAWRCLGGQHQMLVIESMDKDTGN